jgi:hypothetical protein
MKVLDFEVSIKDIENGRNELSDVIKNSLWNHAPHWFDVLDFEDDAIFLEPSLPFYFRKLVNKEKCVMNLEQILYGYASRGALSKTINVFTDPDGVIYLPNMGYVFTGSKGITEKSLTFSSDYKSVIIGSKEMHIQPLSLIKDNQFLMLHHKPYIYEEVELNGNVGVDFLESVEDSVNYSQLEIISSLEKMEKSIPDFYDAIKMTTKEFAVFNCTNYESFAALHYFGCAFLNLAGQKQQPIFFLDDIAHQSGHIIFYALTHSFNKFIRPHRGAPLKDFTSISYEQRSVYGAFHGLFTYTTILHCLDTALREKWFNKEEEVEVYARLGFYYRKFELDLCHMRDNRILDEEGWRYYDMLNSGFDKIKKEYYHIFKRFSYSNQNYNFNFEDFSKANKVL